MSASCSLELRCTSFIITSVTKSWSNQVMKKVNRTSMCLLLPRITGFVESLMVDMLSHKITHLHFFWLIFPKTRYIHTLWKAQAAPQETLVQWWIVKQLVVFKNSKLQLLTHFKNILKCFCGHQDHLRSRCLNKQLISTSICRVILTQLYPLNTVSTNSFHCHLVQKSWCIHKES